MAGIVPHISRERLESLERGDIIQHIGTGASYIVLENRNGDITAIRVIHATNPQEWTLVAKHDN